MSLSVPESSVLDDAPQSYYSLNLYCNTLAGFEEMERLIIRHEYDHQTSANECLAETTIFEKMEELVTSSSADVTSKITKGWNEFIGEFDKSANHAPRYTVSSDFFARFGSGLVKGKFHIKHHGTLTRPECK